MSTSDEKFAEDKKSVNKTKPTEQFDDPSSDSSEDEFEFGDTDSEDDSFLDCTGSSEHSDSDGYAQNRYPDEDPFDDSDDYKELIKACKDGRDDGFVSLLKKVRFVNARDGDENHSPLTHAVKAGHFSIVKMLLDDERTDVKTMARREPLLFLPNSAHGAKICKLLSEKGCDINVSINFFPNSNCASHGTPLMYYLENQENLNLDLFNCLLGLSTDEGLKVGDLFGTPLLLLAVKHQGKEIVQRMLENGADIDGSNKFKVCIFDAAAKKRDVDLLKLLFDARIKMGINHPDAFGNSNLMVALGTYQKTRQIFFEDEHYFIPEEIIFYLIDLGIDVNMQDKDGNTALMITMFHPVFGLDVVKKLLQAGADPSLTNCRKKTALAYALEENGDEDIAEVLIEAGSPIGPTELHSAIHSGSTDSVKKMMSYNKAMPYLFRKKNCFSESYLPENVPHKFYKKHFLSPLISAILTEDLDLVQYFISKNFLNQYDLQLPSDVKVVLFKFVRGCHSKELKDATHKVYDQPLSLRTFSFVSVSTMAGFGTDRAEKLAKFGLPKTLQIELMFK